MSSVLQRRQKPCTSGIVDQRPGRMIMGQLMLSVAPSRPAQWQRVGEGTASRITSREGARVVISNLPDQGRDLGSEQPAPMRRS